ncbi:hypothetical protein LCGC14_1028620 [marine sediment metagenome]|uniref:Uncharacterized protein n=1 Tax=marine sediment metagenome TaxID=412755 RepID=A0A0F9QDD6_9ZZZZ
MKVENIETRIDPECRKEFDDIREKVKEDKAENGISNKRVSDRAITKMIVKHDLWHRIKDDLVGFFYNKKAQVQTKSLFEFMIVAFLIIIIIGIFLYTHDVIVTNLLSPSLESAGQVNFTQAVLDTMGQINTAALAQANIIGIMILFSMSISLIFVAYLTRDENPSIFFVIDLIVIIFAYILAVYLANSYEIVIGSIPFSTIFTSNLSFSTAFLLLLPRMVVILGAIIMIVSYAAIPRRREEEIAGF